MLAVVPAAALIAAGWLRLEQPGGSAGTALVLVAVALAPALARPAWVRAPALVVSALVAVNLAFAHASLGSATVPAAPWVPSGLPAGLAQGFLSFYDVDLPLDRHAHPLMHGMVLLAIWAFSLAVALLAAAGRPLAACLVVLAGTGWPATLLPGSGDVGRGLLILLALLVVLLVLRPGPWPRPGHALAAACAAVAVAAVAAASPAVARSGWLDWQRWDPYTNGARSVSVAYVWRSTYDGIRFPRRATTVFLVQAPARPVYWRATTLDIFDGRGWDEAAGLRERAAVPASSPAAPAAHPAGLVRQKVTIEALRDDHLVGASVPVRYRASAAEAVSVTPGGVAFARYGLSRGERYTVWSSILAPTRKQLAASPPRYPAAVRTRFLEVAPGVVAPPFGAARRDSKLRGAMRAHASDTRVGPYAPLVRQAERLARGARSPYAVASRLEAWFRILGGFSYDEQPPLARSLPPLVGFVTRTRSGYCQHFAGAMALMLRYAGVPARVAAGFTSGSYDPSGAMWVVTDRDAHTWVEVWFVRYGWLPFDPTPGRGKLPGSYTASSPGFDATALGTALGGGPFGLGSPRPRPDTRLPGEGRGAAGETSGGPGGALLAPALAVAALAGLVALLALLKWVRTRRRLAARDARTLARACRATLVAFLADQGLRVPASATSAELGALVERRLGVRTEPFAAALDAARYSPQDQAGGAGRRCRTELATVLREARARLTVPQRLRGLLSLRSLRTG